MDKKAIKQVAIGALVALIVVKFENGIIWNTCSEIFYKVWAIIYPKISDIVAFFFALSPYRLGLVNASEYTKWLMNMGTIATVISLIMYIRCSKSSKLNIIWKLFYLVVFGYATWFANCFMIIFWRRIDSSKQVFGIVSIALFDVLFWLVGYYVFFRSLMAKEKIL